MYPRVYKVEYGIIAEDGTFKRSKFKLVELNGSKDPNAVEKLKRRMNGSRRYSGDVEVVIINVTPLEYK